MAQIKKPFEHDKKELAKEHNEQLVIMLQKRKVDKNFAEIAKNLLYLQKMFKIHFEETQKFDRDILDAVYREFDKLDDENVDDFVYQMRAIMADDEDHGMPRKECMEFKKIRMKNFLDFMYINFFARDLTKYN